MAKKGKNSDADITAFLGPVENLESYVKADWWRQIFNANYLRTDGDVVEDPRITTNEIDVFLNILTPAKDSAVLDLCCGQGRHTLELASRGFINLVGLDRSHYLITRARAENKTQGSQVVFKEGDARKLPFPADSFDYVILAGNSFGYFEAVEDDLRVLKEIQRVLKPYGRLLIDVTDGELMKQTFQPRSWEWIDKEYFVCRERSLSADQQRLISREVITHVRKGVIADQFYAERLYSPESLRVLLESAGLMQITFHAEIDTESSRNQDLGMMGRRILVTADAVKEWTPKRKASRTEKQIVVVLGDPVQRDVIKPDAVFDGDDLYTINELKRALVSLEEFRFVYLDSHRQLMKDLQKNKDKTDFVLNLCDEGFNNDPTRELHVPALLEMLDIPYSGGNPQCLAYCYDKSLVRGVAQEMDIPVPQAFLINPEDTNYYELPINFPVIVKPNFGDSSYGITQENVCGDIPSLQAAISNVRVRFGYSKPILVEQFLTGKDLSVGIIGNPPEAYQILPIIEEDYSSLPPDLPHVCGYEAKWLPDSPYWGIQSIPANLPAETERFLVASCISLFERLGCRDYARFDWRMDENMTPRLLEVNPNPGWCWDGHLAKMAKLAGIEYPEMLHQILLAAERRIAGERVELVGIRPPGNSS